MDPQGDWSHLFRNGPLLYLYNNYNNLLIILETQKTKVEYTSIPSQLLIKVTGENFDMTANHVPPAKAPAATQFDCGSS